MPITRTPSCAGVLLLTLLGWGCGTLDRGGTMLIGHGGMGPDSRYPMDSREALFAALEGGAQGVELDVQLTSDGVLVAYHNLGISGTGSCDGRINGSTWSTLNECLGGQSGNTFFRLDEVLPEALQQYPQAEITLDIKLQANGDWWTYLRSFATALNALQQRPELHGRLLVECRTEDLLRLVHDEIPELPLYYYCDDAETGISTALALKCSGITIRADQINAEQVEQAQAAGLSVTLFGVDGNWALRQALKKNPERIQIDQCPP